MSPERTAHCAALSAISNTSRLMSPMFSSDQAFAASDSADAPATRRTSAAWQQRRRIRAARGVFFESQNSFSVRIEPPCANP